MRFRLCAALTALFWLIGPASADLGDDRIAAARDAAGKGDTQKLALLAASPSGHVLEPYVQYWLLSARIARLTEPAPAAAIADFLQQNAGSWLAEKLRTEWARRLARENQWASFNGEYALLVQPDPEIQCFAIQAGNANGPDLRKTLVTQTQTLLDLPEGCVAPMQGLLADHLITTEDLWQRFRRLVETKRTGAAQRVLGWIPEAQGLNSAAAQQALESPARFLALSASGMTSSRAGRELVLAAFARLARTDARDAASRWQAFNQGAANFSDVDRAYVMGPARLGGRHLATPRSQWLVPARTRGSDGRRTARLASPCCLAGWRLEGRTGGHRSDVAHAA